MLRRKTLFICVIYLGVVIMFLSAYLGHIYNPIAWLLFIPGCIMSCWGAYKSKTPYPYTHSAEM